MFKKQLSQTRPSAQARFPSRQGYTHKHTSEFTTSNLCKPTSHLHIFCIFLFFFNILLQPCGLVEVRLHKNSSAGRSGGIFNTETLAVTCLDSSVAHSCRFLLLFCQVGQAVMEMLMQNAAAFFSPLCFGKNCIFFR